MRYWIATLGVLFLLIIGFILINRNGSKTATTSSDHVVKLSDYKDNTSAQVQYVIEGPIKASETHQSIQITISPTSRQINILTGYQGQVTSSKIYENNSDAYGEFLAALARANFTKVRESAKDLNPTAVCPLENRSHYQIIQNGQYQMDLWSASCVSGSFAGNIPLTAALFQLQIPDYKTLTANVSVGSSSSTGLTL